MPDNSKKFHEFALQSILFKGRSDWYFCYLKTEKIAHVLVVLAQGSGAAGDDITEAARRAASLSGEIAHLAAGEVDAPIVLADIFALVGSVARTHPLLFLQRISRSLQFRKNKHQC